LTTRSARRAVSDTAPLQAEPALRLWGVPELHAASSIVFAAERRFQLLVVLALQAGRWVERDRIAALLWPEHSLPEGRRNLRKVLFKAHQVAADVEANGTALRWTVATDFQAFDEERRAGRLAEALARRSGDPLQAIDDAGNAALSNWFAAERARIDQDWQSVAVDHLLAQTEPQARIDAARQWLVVDPFAEPAVAALLAAERERGQDAEARAVYQRYATHLAEELGVVPARALRDLMDAPAVDPAAARPAATQAALRFIGRKAELRELEALLARPECQMVTIVGPGGIGKSSLARHALDHAAARYTGGSHWVELQDLQSVAQFVARLARLLGIALVDTQDPVDPLARRLNNGSMLVLDNAEQLPDLSALLERLLVAAPLLHLLVTSRKRLRNAREWLLPLQGLAVPDEDSRDLEAASSFDAVRLFEARALAAQHGFRLDTHLQAVIEIVEAVGGMPLAIELAANWVHLLPPAEIARELRESIDLLERNPAARLQPARPEHESMRTVLERTWQLLAPRERQAMEALSVFRGGFTRAAAQRVASVPLPLLSALVDKSLLAVDGAGRFSMHPLVAAYAARVLDDDAERVDDIRTRHAEVFALHLAALTPHAIGDQRVLVAGVNAEYANCAAAWQCAIDGQRADLIYAMARAMSVFFEVRGRYVEGVEWLGAALTMPAQHPATPRALTRLRSGLSMLLHRKGDHSQALALARSGIDAGEDCGDTEAYVGCLLNTGMCLWSAGHAEEARPYYERALAVARQRGDRHCIMWSTGNLGVCLQSLGRIEEAEAHLRLALQGAREVRDAYNTVVNLSNLGILVTWDQRQPAAAQAMYEEALHLCRQHGLHSMENYIESNLGAVCIETRHYERARQHLNAALARSQTNGQLHTEWGCDICLARLEIQLEDWPSAVRRLERVASATRARSLDWDLALAVAAFGELLAAQGNAGGARAVWRWALASNALDEGRRQRLREKLEALPQPPEDEPQAVALQTLEAILSHLRAMAHR
jgi:predicted ATPase/DNA-binding SARP family transcriptional activator/Tfp pilus assembly protein PilF